MARTDKQIKLAIIKLVVGNLLICKGLIVEIKLQIHSAEKSLQTFLELLFVKLQ